MGQVRAGELDRPPDRKAVLDHRDRHDEADETEPRDGGEQADDPQVGDHQDRGRKRDDADSGRGNDAAHLRPKLCRERGRERVGDTRRRRPDCQRNR
jgi:hypothetical protein